MSQCQCLTKKNVRCSKTVSKKAGANPNFCWQHQNCTNVTATPTKTRSPSPKDKNKPVVVKRSPSPSPNDKNKKQRSRLMSIVQSKNRMNPADCVRNRLVRYLKKTNVGDEWRYASVTRCGVTKRNQNIGAFIRDLTTGEVLYQDYVFLLLADSITDTTGLIPMTQVPKCPEGASSAVRGQSLTNVFFIYKNKYVVYGKVDTCTKDFIRVTFESYSHKYREVIDRDQVYQWVNPDPNELPVNSDSIFEL